MCTWLFVRGEAIRVIVGGLLAACKAAVSVCICCHRHRRLPSRRIYRVSLRLRLHDAAGNLLAPPLLPPARTVPSIASAARGGRIVVLVIAIARETARYALDLRMGEGDEG